MDLVLGRVGAIVVGYYYTCLLRSLLSSYCLRVLVDDAMKEMGRGVQRGCGKGVQGTTR